jgi:YgiT-type zinc finger domain-containing protein
VQKPISRHRNVSEGKKIKTDLPFKVRERTIVILKQLPVMQCDRCSEYSIRDSIFSRVEDLLRKSDTSAELEIIPFAA